MTVFLFRLYGAMLICGLIISAGCSGSMQSASQTGGVDVETLDPFAYGDEFTIERDTVIPDDFRNDMLDRRLQMLDAEPDTQTRTLRSDDLRPMLDEIPDDTEYCYRVQIGFYEDRPHAEDLKELAEKRIELAVVVTYDAPFYRVRVGEFTSEEEARECVAFLKGKGFTESRWIKTRMNGH